MERSRPISATAPGPVLASIRRMPEATEDSEVTIKAPISPVAHDRAVLLAEGGDRAGRLGLLQRHHFGLDGQVALDLLVDHRLDAAD
jgi:hypothetical protein